MANLNEVAGWLWDGDWYNSPFIVPVAGCAMIASIAVAGIWSGVRTREIRAQERLARLAQGLPVEPEIEETVAAATSRAMNGQGGFSAKPPRPNDGGGARRAGVVLVSVGVGLIAFFFALTVITRTPEVMSGGAAGLIPLAIGIGFLIDARAKRRDYLQYLEWERSAMTSGAYGTPFPGATAAGTGGFGVPPPPPAGEGGASAAQASDWRPLH